MAKTALVNYQGIGMLERELTRRGFNVMFSDDGSVQAEDREGNVMATVITSPEHLRAEVRCSNEIAPLIREIKERTDK